jgi:hypothetical protein
MNKDTIGIDISKDTLDAHRLSTGAAAQFANSAAGLRALRRWIGAQMPDLVVYEATGAYHAALERGFAGVRIRPVEARCQEFSACQIHGMSSSMRLIL